MESRVTMQPQSEGIRAKRETLKRLKRLSSTSSVQTAATTVTAANNQSLATSPGSKPPAQTLSVRHLGLERRISTSSQALSDSAKLQKPNSLGRSTLKDTNIWKSLGNEHLYSSSRKLSKPNALTPPTNQFYQVSSDFIKILGHHRYKNLLSRPSQERNSSFEDDDRSNPTKTTSRKSSLKSFSRLDRNDTINITIDSYDSRTDLSQLTGTRLGGDPLEENRLIVIKPSSSGGSNLELPNGHGSSTRSADKFYKPQQTAQEVREGLIKRKRLIANRTYVTDACVLLAVIGIIVMIMEGELCANDAITKNSLVSNLLKTLIVLSTLALLFAILTYHSLEIQLVMIDCGADDWKVTVSARRIIKIAQECLICSICPVPGTLTMMWPFLPSDSSDLSLIAKYHSVPVDVILAIPMFLRSYLIGRCMVLHSRQFQDAATRSIAALNRVSVDVRFVVRSLMREKPLTVVIVFTTLYWLIVSWCYTQCERYTHSPIRNNKSLAYAHSLWVIVITFLSIGYGDIVPHTLCGRSLASITGIVGIFVSSVLIATVTNMLELTKAEKHVNAFMAETNVQRRRNQAAATVLQQTWFIYKYRILKPDDGRTRFHQRKFLDALREFRRVKWDQRKLTEEANRLIDASQVHSGLQARMYDLQNNQQILIQSIHEMNNRILGVESMLKQLIDSSGNQGYN